MGNDIRDYKDIQLTGNIETDTNIFREIFKNDIAIRFRRLTVRTNIKLECMLIYFDGMVDSEQLNDGVIEPLLESSAENASDSIAEYIETQVLCVRDVKQEMNVKKIIEGLLYGEAVLLISDSKTALCIDIKGFKTRGIKEPETERLLSGPREGFEETAMLNLAMLRRKLQTPDLYTEMIRVGRRSNTMVFICYLGTLADKECVGELKKRIQKIDIDGILDTNYIAENIKDNRFSLFKTVGRTERPDVVAARLLEGRIAVIADGTPVVITLPYLFSENFQSDEDYYRNFYISSVGRTLRYLSFFISIMLPGVFIALLSYHHALLPTSLAIAVEKLRGGVPFLPITECIIMLIVFEILKETGLRMPQSLGHALSVVGGLVVGQAAVEARIISTPMLIVIALSAVSGLMVQKLSSAVVYCRFFLIILGGVWGLFGIFAGVSVMLGHIFSLSSLGIDYTISLKSITPQALKDTVVRAPWFLSFMRPLFNKNKIRQAKPK